MKDTRKKRVVPVKRINPAGGVKIGDAKTHFSQLVDNLQKGKEKEILILNGQTPVAKLVPYMDGESSFGRFKGIEYKEGTLS